LYASEPKDALCECRREVHIELKVEADADFEVGSDSGHVTCCRNNDNMLAGAYASAGGGN